MGEAVATDTNLRVTDMHFRMNSMALGPQITSENRYDGDVRLPSRLEVQWTHYVLLSSSKYLREGMSTLLAPFLKER